MVTATAVGERTFVVADWAVRKPCIVLICRPSFPNYLELFVKMATIQEAISEGSDPRAEALKVHQPRLFLFELTEHSQSIESDDFGKSARLRFQFELLLPFSHFGKSVHFSASNFLHVALLD